MGQIDEEVFMLALECEEQFSPEDIQQAVECTVVTLMVECEKDWEE